MNTQAKVGSKLFIPMFPTWTASSSDPSVLSAQKVGNTVVLTAIKLGTVWFTLSVAADVNAQLRIDVVA